MCMIVLMCCIESKESSMIKRGKERIIESKKEQAMNLSINQSTNQSIN